MTAIYTIGFAGKDAKTFFEALQRSGARHLIDIRLNNTSQLAGFTKKRDIAYFLDKLTGMTYREAPLLAPTKPILKDYRSSKNWSRYELAYKSLLMERKAEQALPQKWFKEGIVLLCSEPEPSKCHRRLAAEFFKSLYKDISIVHL